MEKIIGVLVLLFVVGMGFVGIPPIIMESYSEKLYRLTVIGAILALFAALTLPVILIFKDVF